MSAAAEQRQARLDSIERDLRITEIKADMAADRARQRFATLEELAKGKQERCRRTHVSSVELRAGDSGKRKIRGYAAVFEKVSGDLGGWREIISPGAFRDAIPVSDIRSLWNHDANYVLGRTKSGTLSVHEDATGLLTECDPPHNPTIRDLVLAPIRRGDVNQMSFAFTMKQPIEDHIEWTDTGEYVLRRILPGGVAELFDVGPVTFPAYQETAVGLRDLEARGLALEQPHRRPRQRKPLTAAERAKILERIRVDLYGPERSSRPRRGTAVLYL